MLEDLCFLQAFLYISNFSGERVLYLVPRHDADFMSLNKEVHVQC